MSLALPVRQCCWLLAISLAAVMLLSVPAILLAGWRGLQGLGLSAGVCLIPGLITVGTASSVTNQAVRLWIVLGGMLVRMLVVLAIALIVHQLQPQLGMFEFYIWLVVFYNVLLLAETWLLLPRPNGPPPQ